MKEMEFRAFCDQRRTAQGSTDEAIKWIKCIEELTCYSIDELVQSDELLYDSIMLINAKKSPAEREKIQKAFDKYMDYARKEYGKRNLACVEKKFDSDDRLKRCSVCGTYQPLGAVWCENCGSRVGKSDSYEKNYKKDRRAVKMRKLKGLIAALLVSVAGLGGIAGYNFLSTVEMPDFVGMPAVEAIEILDDMEMEDVNFECDWEEIDRKTIEKGEYIVTYQNVDPGERVKRDEYINIECRDERKARTEAIDECRYGSALEAAVVTEKFDYSYVMTDLEGNDITDDFDELSDYDKEEYIVSEIKSINEKKKTATYVIGERADVQSYLESKFKATVDGSAGDAINLAVDLGLKIKFQDEDGSKRKAAYDDIVIGFVRVNLDKRRVVLKAESKASIEAKQEQAARSAAAANSSASVSSNSGISSGSSSGSSGSGGTVYISGSGSCYHSSPYCSNMRSPQAVSLSYAQSIGRRACSKCY